MPVLAESDAGAKALASRRCCVLREGAHLTVQYAQVTWRRSGEPRATTIAGLEGHGFDTAKVGKHGYVTVAVGCGRVRVAILGVMHGPGTASRCRGQSLLTSVVDSEHCLLLLLEPGGSGGAGFLMLTVTPLPTTSSKGMGRGLAGRWCTGGGLGINVGRDSYASRMGGGHTQTGGGPKWLMGEAGRARQQPPVGIVVVAGDPQGNNAE